MDRKYKRKGRRKSGRAQILLLLLLLLASGLLASRVMILKNVKVIGNARYSEYDIISIAKLPYGRSIFNIDADAIASNFLGHGFVEFIDAKIKFPDVLELTVRERVPRALVDCMGVYTLVDENCVVMEQYSSMPNYLLPLVTGVKLSRYRVGEAIKSTEPGQIEAVAKIITAIYEDDCQEQISELNVGNLDNLYLMERGGVMVVLGDDTRMDEKLSQMRQAMQELNAMGKTSGKLDVSGSKTIFSQS